MIRSRSLFILPILLLNNACLQKKAQTPGFPYDLSHPVNEYDLPHSLREISGITFYSNHRLACIQDEKGKIYIYSLKKGEVKESVDFGPDHDYEAIAQVNDTFYVLHSTGTLFGVTGFDTDSQQTTRYDTFLKKENNTEGLCYDEMTHSLLIACKGVSHKKEKADIKEIYAFDLLTKDLSSKPVYRIKLDDLAKYMRDHQVEMPKTDNENAFFEPSEIAVHPQTNDIYILSSVGKMIIVMDREGNIRDVALLDPAIAAHPEGMTFSKNGTLYISSEGKGSKKVILEYAPRK